MGDRPPAESGVVERAHDPSQLHAAPPQGRAVHDHGIARICRGERREGFVPEGIAPERSSFVHPLSSEGVRRARADVTATMKKRLDIAQRLTDITAQYGEHEKVSHLTIGEMTTDPGAIRSAETSIGHVVSEIRTIASHYPDLKANQTYQLLMSQLDALEERILAARMAYNEAVRVYNTERSEFPQVLIAPHIGFPEAPYYEVDDTGLDRLAEFRTDDGTMLRQGIGRIAARLTGSPGPTAPPARAAILDRSEGDADEGD